MAWSQVEVLTTWLSVHPPLDIIPMLTNVSLEALSGFANIFVMGIVRTVWFNTFPVVDTIFTLTVKVILDCVFLIGNLTNYFTSWPHCVGTSWTLTTSRIVAGASSPSWSGSGGSHRPGCWFGRESSSTE